MVGQQPEGVEALRPRRVAGRERVPGIGRPAARRWRRPSRAASRRAGAGRRGPCQVLRPPLTPITWPVTYDASSVTRKAVAAAMSSGRPMRRTGVRCSCSSTAPAEPALRLVGPQHRRVDETGRDGVDGDALGSELEGQRLGQPDDGGLGGHVGGHVGLTALGARRGDVDDPAPAGVEHVGDHHLAAVVGAREVDRVDPLPRVEVDLEERAELLQAGVVDEDRGCTEALRRRGRRPPPRRPGRSRRPRRRSAVPPAAVMAAAASSAEAVLRSSTATAAPSAASRTLMASPIPEPPPVTTATLPLKAPDASAGAGVAHWIGSSPAKVVRCMSRGEPGS